MATTADRLLWPTRIGLLIILLATAGLVIYVRLRFAAAPLERDEGEYAYAGQLILRGIPPYELAYNMKFPGAYYAYAVLMAIFGQTATGIRVGLLAVHLVTVGFVFALGRRLVGPAAAAIGASAFALLALDRWSMGIFGHATHFVLLPAVAGLFVLHGAMRSGRASAFVSAGFLMGLAIAMKQHALFFALLALGFAWWSGRASATSDRPWRADYARKTMWKRAALVGGGLALSFVMLATMLAAHGVLGRFWFWTFQYGAAYVSGTPASIATTMFGMAWGYITQASAGLWYAALAGIVLLFVVQWPRESRVFLVAWLVAAALSVVPGYFFRPHYFIVLMPVAGLLVGVAIVSIDRALSRRLSAVGGRVVSGLICLGLGIAWIVPNAGYLFRMTDTEVVRSVYQANPFPESPEIARYLGAHTERNDRIAVFGSEPQIFFYADRISATGYIYMYSLTEPQPFMREMQDEMIREVESAQPKYLVHVGMSSSWTASLQPDTRMLTWMNAYVAKCYDRVGVVDIDVNGTSTVVWDDAVATYQPRTQSLVVTYRRRATAECSAR